MASHVAWLDTSPDDQRRVRELIALFSEKGTLDELGLGQIRDVFSNGLFPGTSTIQTRARYFLLVPWAYQSAARHGREGATLRQHADHLQRMLIATLATGPDRLGLIGAQSGVRVKTLPSTIYWNGLLVWGILRRDVSVEGLLAPRTQTAEGDELHARLGGDWHPTLPPVPEGFPQVLEGGLSLMAPEASWLRERILDSVPETLLAHLVASERVPDQDSRYPWLDPACVAVSDEAAEVLRLAHGFSLVMEGASRLYGVAVAEAYERAGFNAVPEAAEQNREAYQTWWGAVGERRHLIESWKHEEFWRYVLGQNPRITRITQRFVDAWFTAVTKGDAAHGLHPTSRLRDLVEQREREVKKGQARLANPKLLELWGGGSAGGLNYRWPTVRRIVTDIQEGMTRA